MEIDKLREKIAEKLNWGDALIKWIDILQDTNPANYGVEDIDVYVDYKDIWVDIPDKNFTFKNASVSFSARLVSSNDS